MVTVKNAIIGTCVSLAGVGYFMSQVPAISTTSGYRRPQARMQEELDTLQAYKDDHLASLEQAARNRKLYVPHDPLDVKTPTLQRSARIGFDDFMYDGEVISFIAADPDGYEYPISYLSHDKMKQDELLEMFRVLFEGGHQVRVPRGAMFNPRSNVDMATGKLPFPVCGRYEMDSNGVRIKTKQIYIDDPNFLELVPKFTALSHYPASPFDWGLETISRLQIEGMTKENREFTRFFLWRYAKSLGDQEQEYLTKIMTGTEKIRNDMLERIGMTLRQRLEDSKNALELNGN